MIRAGGGSRSGAVRDQRKARIFIAWVATDPNKPDRAGRIADRQQGVRVDVRRQAERGLHFLLELQVQRRQLAPRPRARAAKSMFCTAG